MISVQAAKESNHKKNHPRECHSSPSKVRTAYTRNNFIHCRKFIQIAAIVITRARTFALTHTNFSDFIKWHVCCYLFLNFISMFTQNKSIDVRVQFCIRFFVSWGINEESCVSIVNSWNRIYENLLKKRMSVSGTWEKADLRFGI